MINFASFYHRIISNLPLDNPLFMKTVYGVLAVSIFIMIICSIFIIYRLKDSKGIVAKIHRMNDSIHEDAMKSIKKNDTTRTFYEHIDLLLARSQVKYYLKFNFWIFLLLTILSFFFGFYLFIDLTNSYVTSFAAGIGIGFLPYVILEVIASFKARELKGQILSLIPIMTNNAKLTNGDVYQMIKRSSQKVKEPMKIYLEEFIDEYDSGLKIEKCFDNLRGKILDYRFTRLVDCLEVHLFKGGNVIVTLGSLQKEYLAREIEEDRRKKENLSNVIGVYLAVISNLVIVYIISRIMPEVIVELKSSSFDKYMLIALINTLLSLFIAFKATKIGTNNK
ncbi:hypothetical protein [Alkaliphilus sp. B6464]|uniref:hypothetical protein n=1 Tax=Alkaliphilus sp. B6464 TaxID=2731219 RepID=UPI001BAB51E2|nr:hypothetical protein [Alkaliphilus sp. B6464]QUH22004.1 hypothetical protein HYG84_19050 [Alkaliphilus sp. B6464]